MDDYVFPLFMIVVLGVLLFRVGPWVFRMKQKAVSKLKWPAFPYLTLWRGKVKQTKMRKSLEKKLVANILFEALDDAATKKIITDEQVRYWCTYIGTQCKLRELLPGYLLEQLPKPDKPLSKSAIKYRFQQLNNRTRLAWDWWKTIPFPDRSKENSPPANPIANIFRKINSKPKAADAA